MKFIVIVDNINRRMKMKILLTVKEAANDLSISRALLYKLVSEGKIRRVKIRKGPSGAVRFRPEDLHDFAKRHLVS